MFSYFTFVFSITFIKSVASLRRGFCDYDIGCSNVPISTKEEVLSDHLMSHEFKEIAS